MKGKEKAAVLLISLGPEISGNVLKELKESEIEQLTMQIFATDSVQDDVRKEVITDCYQIAAAQGYLRSGGSAYAEEMLTKALGQEKASELMGRLLTSVRPRHFDFIKDMDP